MQRAIKIVPIWWHFRAVKPVWRHPLLVARSYASKDTSAETLGELRFKNLNKLVREELENGQLAKAKVLNVIKTCKSFQDSVYAYNKLDPEDNELIKRSNGLITEVLTSKEVTFDRDLLSQLLRLQPEYPTLKSIIEAWYKRDPKAYIESDLAMIPFRRLLWDADFQRALDYIELTTGSQRYFDHRKDLMKTDLGYFGGTMVGLIAVIHVIVKIYYPDIMHSGTGGTKYGIYGIYAMIVSYFVNCGFLAALSFSSKGMENGALMFKHNTMPWDWYQRVDQMSMCAKILAADAAIHGADGFATRDIVSRINEMGFDVNEPEQEIMMRQYWYSSGDGFVWCEPDLDPAEMEWWQHLDERGVKKFWDPDYQKIDDGEKGAEPEDEDEDLVLPGN